jgi:hypothetical protein
LSVRFGRATSASRCCHQFTIFPMRERGRSDFPDRLEQRIDQAVSAPAAVCDDAAVYDGVEAGLARVLEYWDKTGKARHVSALRNRLAEAQSLEGMDRHVAVANAVDLESQPVLNLIIATVTGATESLQGIVGAEPVVGLLEQLVAPDEAEEWGVAKLTRYLLLMATWRIADQLERALADGVPQDDEIETLLFGAEGRRVVGKLLWDMLSSAGIVGRRT